MGLAELEDFVDPKLKNVCSHIQMRLAFGVMSHASR
jgi:ABC-type polysaccharide/polyol phosphate transport system ATPase subunit